jgi:predicted anti-sigma-YlaC factor YlaD
LFALASGKLGDGDGRKMVVEEHLRGCAECRKRFEDILSTEQEWGG